MERQLDSDIPAHQRSCLVCAKAKTKCVKAADSSVCTRCARLKKECHFKEPALRRKKISKSSRNAQFEKLESKIEHLVNALATSQAQAQAHSIQNPTPPTSYHGQESPAVSQPETTSNTQYDLVSTLCGGDGCEVNRVAQTKTSSFTSFNAQNSIVSIVEAEALLDRYRRLMAPEMPFVVLQDNVTASQLAAEKPFLLRCIVTVACIHDLAKQQLLLKHCMRELAERVLINSEKNIGLLEAMLVLVGWYHPHVFAEGQLTNILNLAVAMAADLGIDRPASTCGGFKPSINAKGIAADAVSAEPAGLAEHRVFAGVYYLTSMLATAFVKFRATPFTQFLDESLERLSKAQEHESDKFLIQLVRLQRLVEDIHAVSPSAALPRLYIASFQAQLDKLRQTDRCNEENVLLRLQYLAVDVQLWELSLNDVQDKKAPILPNQLEDLASLVKAIKSLLNVFFSIQISAYLTIPFSCFNQFAHAFIALTKLASMENEGWSLDNLNDMIHFRSTVDEATSRFEAVASSSPDGMTIRNDTFNLWGQRLRWMRQAYDAKFPIDATPCLDDPSRNCSTSRQQTTLPVQQPHQLATPPDDFLSDDFFNNLDDAFWNSFRTDIDIDFSDMRAA